MDFKWHRMGSLFRTRSESLMVSMRDKRIDLDTISGRWHGAKWFRLWLFQTIPNMRLTLSQSAASLYSNHQQSRNSRLKTWFLFLHVVGSMACFGWREDDGVEVKEALVLVRCKGKVSATAKLLVTRQGDGSRDGGRSDHKTVATMHALSRSWSYVFLGTDRDSLLKFGANRVVLLRVRTDFIHYYATSSIG